MTVVLAVAAGCTSEADEVQADPTPLDPPPEQATPAPTPSPSPSPPEELEARYHKDSDGNAIPDFLEVEMGLDPEADDCLQESCPDVDDALLTPDPEGFEHNVLLILDASGSMAGPDGAGNIKMDAARAALERYVVGTPDTTGLGLMVYGHRGDNSEASKAESCDGIEVFAPLGELDPDNATAVFDRFGPTGWTPIADSLTRAADEFAGLEGQNNRVVLVTDGIETCDGDPVAAATALSESGIAVIVDVVGFDIAGSEEEAALREIAEVTGGSYTSARDAAELNTYVDNLLEQQQALFQAYLCLRRAWLESGACTALTASEARERLTQERDTNPMGSARYEALDQLIVEIARWSIEHNDRAREVAIPRLEELRAAYERARQRYEERYDRSLSWSLISCPYADTLV